MQWLTNFFYTTSWKDLLNKKDIENVCFSGGGIKGITYLGVDRAFEEFNLWTQIKRFMGSSAGAIFASGAACRIPYSQMSKEIENTDFTKFEDAIGGVIGEGLSLVEYFGLYKGDYFYNWFSDILERNIGNKEITFQQVFERFGSELIMTTTNITLKKLVYLDRHNNPDMQIRDAVRMSMSLPFFYRPIEIETNDGIVNTFVDGGYSNNFPIDYLDKFYPNKKDAFNKTIGFSVTNDDKPTSITTLVQFITKLMETDAYLIETLRLSPEDQYRIVNIDAFDIQTTDFNISKKDIERLEESGYKATKDFLNSIP